MPRETHRIQKKFDVRGFGLVRANDRLPDELLAIARNVRIFRLGELWIRPGLTRINPLALSGNLHSIKRLNNPVTGATQSFCRIVGNGTKVATDDSATHTIFTNIQESGSDLIFSGNPLSFVIARPFQAVDPWCYIGDLIRTRKVRSDRVNYNWGGAPPIKALQVALGSPVFSILESFEAVGAWANGGTAGALSTGNREAAAAITHILYDVGTAGWACVVPTTFTQDIQPGMLFQMSVNETTLVRVDEIFDQVTSTTIGSIQYDNTATNTGLCTIQPTIAIPNLKRDMMLRIATAENVRVLEVTASPDGIDSFRCSTTVTRAAGNAIDGFRSFRCYFNNVAAHTNAETFSCKYLLSALTTGLGTITKTVNLDLSNISNRPIQPDDLLHLSVWMDAPANLIAGRIIFNLDGTDTTLYTVNVMFREFRASDLTPATLGTQSLITTQRTIVSRAILEHLQARQIDIASGDFTKSVDYLPQDPELIDMSPDTVLVGDGVSTQTSDGSSNWTELIFKISEFERVGSDSSRTWANVTGVRIQFNVSANTNIRVDDLWVGGTYGPYSPIDDDSLLPYYYTHRYRSSITGTKTIFGPPMRSGIMPRRNAIILTPQANSYVDPQFDKIDIARFGGNSDGQWHIIGTIDVGSTFQDTYPDDAVLGMPIVDLTTDFQPFPTTDRPRTGTCNVNGTSITWLTGDTFNTSWSRNSDIYLAGKRYTLFTNPSDTTHLELNENGGTQAGVSFYLPEPTILGQPLPQVWGTLGGALFGDTLFACGDAHQKGVLFYTNPGDPDTCKETNQLEICSGSEVLMNGVIYRGRCYVASDQLWYEVIPRFGYGYSIIDDKGLFIAQDTANSYGLYAANAICAGDVIYYRSKDGIYAYDGGQAKLISADLYPLFPHAGVVGLPITLKSGSSSTTYYPPDDTQLVKHRMEFQDGLVYYTYPDTSGTYRTLVYNTLTQGWNSEDTYTPQVTNIYAEEGDGIHSLLLGGLDARLYQATSNSDDNGIAIPGWIRTGSDNLEDARTSKRFYELWVDADTTSVDANAIPYLDDSSIIPITPTINTPNRTTYLADITNKTGQGVLARNIALDYQFNKGIIYGWEFSFASEFPYLLVYEALPTSWGLHGFMHVGEIYLSYTSNDTFTLKIVIDNVEYPYIIPSSRGVQAKFHLVPQAVKGKLHGFRIVSPSQSKPAVDSCEVAIGQWDRQGHYQIIEPFNDGTYRVGVGAQ